MLENEAPVNGEILLPQEDQAYIDRMIAKADGVGADTVPPADAPADEPALIAGKFKSQDDLVAAYKALEAKLGQRADTPPAPAPSTSDTPVTIDAARDAVTEAGLDFASFEREYRESGDLGEASRAALAAKGIGQDMVDAFLSGQRAAETLGRQKVFETVGGEAQYRAMIQWAQANLDAEEIAAYNEVAKGVNFAALRMAAAGLFSRYEASVGREPALVTADSTRPTAEVFESWAQVREQMRDPRYTKDEAFRAAVERKLAASSL